MAVPTVVQVIVEFTDGEISNVLPHVGDITVSSLTAADRKKFRRSKYGLRPLDVLSEYDPDPESLVPRKCFMVIGGFKVQVPCPPPSP